MAQATVYNGNCGAGGTDGDNITWSLNTEDSTLVLTGSGIMANYDNSSNRAPWYQYRSFVKTLTVGEGITNIGEYAFYYLEKAKTVNLPTTVVTIEKYGFYWCTGMQNVNFATPSALTEIKEDAFAGNGFTSITLPEGLTTIGTSGISSCLSLVEVNLPSTLTTLGSYAFRQCRRLVLTVPSSVTSIANNAFDWLPNVFYNGTATGSPWGAKAINGYQEGWLVYESSAKTKLCACDVDAYGEIIIPESVTEIGDDAFANANKITSVALPSHLTKIGQYAFDYCSKMEMFTSWPSTLTSIGNSAFRGCSAFTSFTMPTGVTQLSTDLLEWCSNITWVHLHSGVKSVGYEAFYGCKKLKTITCEALQPPTMPSSTSGDPFKSDSIDKITLRVPCESKELYQTAAYWKTLGTIQGYDAPTMTLQTSNAAWGTAEVTAQDCYNVTIMATPTDGYFFKQWSDGNQYNPRRLTLNGDSSLTAIFTDVEPPCYDTESEFSVVAEGSSYTWNGEKYTQSGDYQQTFTIEGGCDSLVTLHLTIPWQNGVLPGVFSIAEDKKVKFSQGALQFNAAQGTHATADGTAQGTWRFADSQYYTESEGNKHISSTYNGWFDLFGWGTSGYDNTANDPLAVNYQPWSVAYDYVEAEERNQFGYGPSSNMPDSNLVGTSANYDWGVYNAISNGGNQPGLWRTLSLAEWEYVLYGRQNASNLYAQATVVGVKGIIILPDGGITSANFTPTTADWTTNKYSAAEWVELENQGAVFFPAMGGYRYHPSYPLEDEGTYGPYWTTTCAQRRSSGWCGGYSYARAVYWGSSTSDGGCYYGGHFSSARSRARGYRVRLVQETESTCEPVEINIAMQSCDLYRWNDVEYTESGNYTQTLQRANGCDSIVNMALTITPSYKDVNVYETAETSYTWEGTTYTASGGYTKTLQTVAGCDSIVTLHLTVTGETPQPLSDCMDLAAFLQTRPADDTTFCNLTILYTDAQDTWVTDEKGQVAVNMDTYFGEALAPGTQLKGVRGHYSDDNGQARITPVSAHQEAIGGNPVRPVHFISGRLNDYESFYQNYVTMEWVDIAESGGEYYAFGDYVLQIFNPYNFASVVPGQRYNLTGVITMNNGQQGIVLLAEPELQEMMVYTIIGPAKVMGSEFNESDLNNGMNQSAPGIYSFELWKRDIEIRSDEGGFYRFYVVGNQSISNYCYPEWGNVLPESEIYMEEGNIYDIQFIFQPLSVNNKLQIIATTKGQGLKNTSSDFLPRMVLNDGNVYILMPDGTRYSVVGVKIH